MGARRPYQASKTLIEFETRVNYVFPVRRYSDLRVYLSKFGASVVMDACGRIPP